MKEWIKLTSAQINQLDRNTPVIVPLGLVEAHGPHLAVSVDINTAEYFSRSVAEATDAILAPCLPYGFADEMREYPGTLGVSAETLMSIIADLCTGFCTQGFKKIIFITGHGANKGPCELAFYRIWKNYPDFKGACWNWWSDCGITGIHHADKGETEVALAVGTPSNMENVKDFKVDKPWYKIRSRFELDPESGGINGNPSEADISHGRQVRDKAVKALIAKVRQAF
ncbi:creatininase family protein [Fulvivirgaceae bacterium BMA12]|uniref:Creatininase family protein n=1 Tax=Agaribacillus aureus TaxID=3051825 RepID=A0ABT8LD63_9BACT|nr:creatininase family protein [Fulvivirgaceae bacterium BMA12]